MYDADTGAELRAMRNPSVKAWSFGLAWHPEGHILAAATFGSLKIHLWDTRTATEVMPPLEGHTGSGIFMAFNRAGDRLLSAGWDRQARLWDAVSGRLLLTMPWGWGAAVRT